MVLGGEGLTDRENVLGHGRFQPQRRQMGVGISGKEAHRPWLGALPVWGGEAGGAGCGQEGKALNATLRAGLDPEAARSREGCEQEKGDLSSTRSRCGPLLVHTGPSRSLR